MTLRKEAAPLERRRDLDKLPDDATTIVRIYLLFCFCVCLFFFLLIFFSFICELPIAQAGKDSATVARMLRDYWQTKHTDPNDKFLRDYIVNQRWRDERENHIPTYREVVGDDARRKKAAADDDDDENASDVDGEDQLSIARKFDLVDEEDDSELERQVIDRFRLVVVLLLVIIIIIFHAQCLYLCNRTSSKSATIFATKSPAALKSPRIRGKNELIVLFILFFF